HVYVLKYTTITDALVKKHAMARFDQNVRLLEGLSEELQWKYLTIAVREVGACWSMTWRDWELNLRNLRRQYWRRRGYWTGGSYSLAVLRWDLDMLDWEI